MIPPEGLSVIQTWFHSPFLNHGNLVRVFSSSVAAKRLNYYRYDSSLEVLRC